VLTCSLLGVGDGQWRPLYDLYTYSQNGKPSTSVSLHFRVNVSQSTGEDWNDAELILSTSETDILNAGIPKTDSLVIEPKPKPPLPPPHLLLGSRHKRKLFPRSVLYQGSPDGSVPSASRSDDAVYCEEDAEVGESVVSLAAALPEMSEGGAVISKSPMAVNYTVDERTTIPSDGKSHKVLVAVVPLEAVISHITTPRKSPLAYLQVCASPSRSIIQLTITRHAVFSEEYERVLPATRYSQRLPQRILRFQNGHI